MMSLECETHFVIFNFLPSARRRRGSVVGTATDYGLDESRLGQDFSLLQIVQTASEIHPTSCPMGTGGSFPGDKAAGA
jgi:hypothetical protein